MSSLSAIGSSNSLIQQLQSSGRPSGPPPGPPPGHSEAIESVAEEAGLDALEISDLMTKLNETAESVKESGEGREAMKQAMDSVLQEAGIDTEALHEKLSSLSGSRPSGRPPQGSGQTGQDEETTSSQLDASSIFEMLQALPVGSLVDSNA